MTIKKLIAAGMPVLFFLIGIPLLLGLIFGGGGGEGKDKADLNKVETPRTIKVWITSEKKVREIDFEEYIACVTASEMPSNFNEEAIKAQSVAARTYAVAKLVKYEQKKPEAHPDAPICDTTHCQAYKNEKKLIELHADGWEESGFKKIKKACKATEGELLYYNGELVMQPLFFSSSGGQTENSEDVFSGAYPYLVSVASPDEDGASHADEKKTFSLTEIRNAMNAAYPDRPTGAITNASLKILSRTAGGRVNEMQIGDAIFRGTEVRNALGLSSALFGLSFDDNGKITFTSDGFGHGVGLSQYGADGMGRNGSGYKKILCHYYTGTEVH